MHCTGEPLNCFYPTATVIETNYSSSYLVESSSPSRLKASPRAFDDWNLNLQCHLNKDPSIWFLDYNYHESIFSMFKSINGLILNTMSLLDINYLVEQMLLYGHFASSAKKHVVGWFSTGPKLRRMIWIFMDCSMIGFVICNTFFFF